jgi:hypothetical protein
MRSDRTVTDIASDLLREFTTLIRKDFLLARTEVSEKVGVLGGAVALMVAGAVFLMAALVLLLQALIAYMVAQGFTLTAATLIVGGGALILGILLLWIGVSRMRPANLVPNRTIDQLNRDVAVARHQVSRP